MNQNVLPEREKRRKESWMHEYILDMMDERKKYKDQNGERIK